MVSRKHTGKYGKRAELLPFVIPYHKKFLPLQKILMKHWCTIASDKILSSIFKNNPFLCFTRHKNLHDHLVHTTLKLLWFHISLILLYSSWTLLKTIVISLTLSPLCIIVIPDTCCNIYLWWVNLTQWLLYPKPQGNHNTQT